MKSMTKKVVALSATFAMAASFAASAATISGVTATANSADDITVTYTHDIAADGQATILVYEGETPFAGGTGDNVGYINQDTATGSFTFAMRDTLVPQTGSKEFKVLVGGTDVATAGTATFALGEAAGATTYSISGTVDNAVYFGEGSDEYNDMFKMTIDVCSEDYETVYKTITVDSSKVVIDEDNGVYTGSVPFEITDLEIGTSYGLAFRRVGVATLYGSVSANVKDSLSDVAVELAVGDVDESDALELSDISAMVAYAKTANDDNYNAKYDVIPDFAVGIDDVGNLASNVKAFDNDAYFLALGE